MSQSEASTRDAIKSLLLYALPQHALSRVVYWLTRRRTAAKNPAIRWFIDHFGVDMQEAVEPDPSAYASFNAFFTRAIKPELRPLVAGAQHIACPVDGRVSQLGPIRAGRIFQAKGHDYSAQELLGGSAQRAAPFQGGRFATLYLSPRDYHRIHMPLDARLREMIHIPGRLFSVAPFTTRYVPRLFARNERVVALFDTAAGPMAMVLVGAMNVAAIETVWAGLVTPPKGKTVQAQRYDDADISLKRGEEMGRFNMGSTVILLFADNTVTWEETLGAGTAVKMGQLLAHYRPNPAQETQIP